MAGYVGQQEIKSMHYTTPGQRIAPWVALATLLLTGMALAVPASAADPASTTPSASSASSGDTQSPPAAALEQDLQDSKQKALALDRDLSRLEHELLFPATTRFGIFVALEQTDRRGDDGLKLRSVQLKVDDKVVANHVYSADELAALRAGGIQQAFAGNLAPGKHRLTASVTTDDAGHDRHADTSMKFTKTNGPQYVELAISAADDGPQLRVRVRN